METHGQASGERLDSTDTGIDITADRFRSLVVDYLHRMRRGDDMESKDYVTMTRLWNTITFGRLSERDPLFRQYSATFFPGYVERVARSLDALPTKGMALYSKKYDLFIGGKPYPGSHYTLK